MRGMRGAGAVLAAAALVVASGCGVTDPDSAGEVTVSGAVTALADGKPIEGATVRITLGQGIAATDLVTTQTDASGAYTLTYDHASQTRAVFLQGQARQQGFRDSAFLELKPSGDRVFVNIQLEKATPGTPQ